MSGLIFTAGPDRIGDLRHWPHRPVTGRCGTTPSHRNDRGPGSGPGRVARAARPEMSAEKRRPPAVVVVSSGPSKTRVLPRLIFLSYCLSQVFSSKPSGTDTAGIRSVIITPSASVHHSNKPRQFDLKRPEIEPPEPDASPSGAKWIVGSRRDPARPVTAEAVLIAPGS